MQPKLYVSSQHNINRNLIDSDALWVIHRLRQAGHQAYIVGGSIRDLLADKSPKDFDISTSALPEEIRELFGRRCILIGRRFRLAHIRFGHKVVEVATFRSGDNEVDLIVRDNQWGSGEEDVLRRDFTMNGLFYDPEENTIIDYVGGLEDISHKLIRSIGDPIIRFKQDPVRMIRLLKFQARFNFEIAPDAANALHVCREEITKSSPARILEELLRMLESGSATRFIWLMREWKLLELLLPALTRFLSGPHGEDIYRFLSIADEMNRASAKPLDRSILTSCLLYSVLESEVKSQFLDQSIVPHMGQIVILTNSLIKDFVTSSFTHFPRRLSTTMSFILSMQWRLTPISGKRHPKQKMLRNNEFGLALQFMKMRALLNKDLMPDYANWRELYRQFERHGGDHPHPHKRKPRQKANV